MLPEGSQQPRAVRGLQREAFLWVWAWQEALLTVQPNNLILTIAGGVQMAENRVFNSQRTDSGYSVYFDLEFR